MLYLFCFVLGQVDWFNCFNCVLILYKQHPGDGQKIVF